MESPISPTITSFVIRFVLSPEEGQQDGSSSPNYRGSIRHIQSEQELNFISWSEAVAFIERFVPLNPKHEE
jgi:hypothetical protein